MLSRILARLKDKAYRTASVKTHTSVHRAAQIASMRDERGWTQSKLAHEAGMGQGRISLLEDPNHESVSLNTLQRIAEAFDVALVVTFVNFKRFAEWTNGLEESDLKVRPFDPKWAEPPPVPRLPLVLDQNIATERIWVRQMWNDRQAPLAKRGEAFEGLPGLASRAGPSALRELQTGDAQSLARATLN